MYNVYFHISRNIVNFINVSYNVFLCTVSLALLQPERVPSAYKSVTFLLKTEYVEESNGTAIFTRHGICVSKY